MAGLLQFMGAAAVTTGAALIAPAAGFIVGGFFLVLIGVAVERAKSAE
ncbi:MAG TPA: hypothetical protein VIG24_13175 [Acidimicrobiia bacterium]|jgi:hypothetical protein